MGASREPDRRRVTLRAALPGDATSLFAWRGEESVRRHQPLQETTASELRSDLARQRMDDLYRGQGERFQWIVLVDGESAGWITLAILSWEHGLAEIGYALASEFQGLRLMERALAQLLPELFVPIGIERLEARCSVENLRSQALLEKLGFQCEGKLRSYFSLRGRRIDNFLYALLRTDFVPSATR
ncbi:MAG: GNAT family protein [Thermoanaerobaculia bacterium]